MSDEIEVANVGRIMEFILKFYVMSLLLLQS